MYDYKALPVETQAALLCGLPDDSRVIRKMNKVQFDTKTILLAAILDELKILVYARSKKGTPKPKSILESMLKEKGEATEKNGIRAFNSGADFMAAREKLLERIEDGERKRDSAC